MKNIFVLFMLLIAVNSAQASQLPTKPKLLLVLVYDQFRADMLTHHVDHFLPAIQKNGQLGGYRYLMENGAYFPNAEYEVLQSMTCLGHAMILTGSYPYANGISLNENYDVQQNKVIYCAEDPEFGFSPRRLHGSTVGDELKMSTPGSKVIAVSLKDRSAIMLGGHGADLALWLDSSEMKWTTSAYYDKKTDLTWLKTFNEKVSVLKDVDNIWKPHLINAEAFSHKAKAQSGDALGSPLGVDLTNKVAMQLLKQYKLGQGNKTDILAISFSSHDISGHKFGPNSPEMEELTLQEDRLLSELLNDIQKSLPGGLKNVLITMTADHGVATTIEVSKSVGIQSGRIDSEDLLKKLNDKVSEQFGSSKEPWFASVRSFNYYLSKTGAHHSKKDEVLLFAKEWMQQQKGVFSVLTLNDYKAGLLPPEQLGRQVNKSYIPGTNGDLIIIPHAFWYEESDKNLATHMTGYAYDRTVPLILVGQNIKQGVYLSPVHVVDLAPTLSTLLNQIPPALSEGKVLHEAIKTF